MSDLPRARERGKPKQEVRLAKWMQKLKEEGVEIGDAVMAKKVVVNPARGQVEPIVTNMFAMNVTKQDVEVYRYDIVIEQQFTKQDGTTGRIMLTKKAYGGDTTAYDHREKCGFIFDLCIRTIPPLKDSRALYYDLQSIAYSLDRLQMDSQGDGKEEASFDVPMTEELQSLFQGAAGIRVTISPVQGASFVTNLRDLEGVNRDLTRVSRTLLQFFDIATSQHVMFHRVKAPDGTLQMEHCPISCNRSYLMEPTNHGFQPQDVAHFPDNQSYLAIGAQKSTHCIEGVNKSKQLALVIETKKTPFHVCEQLLDKVKAMVRNINSVASYEIEKINSVLSGLEVQTEHLGYTRRYVIKRVSEYNSDSAVIDLGPTERTSVKEFFAQHHGFQINYTLLPVLEMKDGAKLPIELCRVCDNERVKTGQQTSMQVQQMIRHCAVSPSVLVHQNHLTYNSLGLGPNNQRLASASIVIDNRPIELNARYLPLPTLVFGGNRAIRPRPSDHTWQNPGTFLVPGGCNRWAVFAFLGREVLSQQDFISFLDRFAGEATRRGIRMPSRPINENNLRSIRPDRAAIERAFQEALSNQCDFVVAVHGDKDDDSHALIKYFEQRYSLQTQAFRHGTVVKTLQGNQPVTIQNIVNKTNLKLGGCNYSIEVRDETARELIDSDWLIVGIAINHPGAGRKGGEGKSKRSMTDGRSGDSDQTKPPSIVGYSANIGNKNAFEFVGDYLFHEFIGEIEITVVPEIIEQCLGLYKQNRGGQLPKRLMLFHNGANEGWFEYLLRFEVPLVKACLRKNGCGDVNVTLIVPNRLHSTRFFQKQINPRDRAPDQNIKPGLLVDNTVVHSEFLEYYVNSHRALQGTAKSPKYTVLIDDNNLSMDQLAMMTYHLCYGHQIVNLPTSLPTPVYVASEYAQRGRKVFNQWDSDRPDIRGDYNKMTDELSYRKVEGLKRHRLNA